MQMRLEWALYINLHLHINCFFVPNTEKSHRLKVRYLGVAERAQTWKPERFTFESFLCYLPAGLTLNGFLPSLNLSFPVVNGGSRIPPLQHYLKMKVTEVKDLVHCLAHGKCSESSLPFLTFEHCVRLHPVCLAQAPPPSLVLHGY